MQIQVPDAAVGADAKSENDMENALERELGKGAADEAPGDAQDAAKGGADKTDAATAKPPGTKKD
jgi:hypothetical protein